MKKEKKSDVSAGQHDRSHSGQVQVRFCEAVVVHAEVATDISSWSSKYNELPGMQLACGNMMMACARHVIQCFNAAVCFQVRLLGAGVCRDVLVLHIHTTTPNGIWCSACADKPWAEVEACEDLYVQVRGWSVSMHSLHDAVMKAELSCHLVVVAQGRMVIVKQQHF
jgi:hypothetical protein